MCSISIASILHHCIGIREFIELNLHTKCILCLLLCHTHTHTHAITQYSDNKIPFCLVFIHWFYEQMTSCTIHDLWFWYRVKQLLQKAHVGYCVSSENVFSNENSVTMRFKHFSFFFVHQFDECFEYISQLLAQHRSKSRCDVFFRCHACLQWNVSCCVYILVYEFKSVKYSARYIKWMKIQETLKNQFLPSHFVCRPFDWLDFTIH